MPLYRKKPVVVEVWQFTSPPSDVPEWLRGDRRVKFELASDGIYYTHAFINTLEGVMRADVGDYIVRGVEDELYPVKPAIFHKTYERVEEENTPLPRDETI